MDTPSKNTSEKFNFLNSHIEKEAHIYEVLNEIHRLQEQYLKNGQGQLATIDDLTKSRNIKIPLTPSRNKNIQFLVDQLLKNYPDNVRSISSLQFNVDPSTKKLSINEMSEYAVNLKNEDLNRIEKERDDRSLEGLLDLLTKFRLFNLTKLIKNAQNKAHISRIVKMELGTSIFTFKHFSLDKNQFEHTEDYCFHQHNYEQVRSKLNMDELKNIISVHSTLINRRLKKFGILNTDFADYRDNKLDYLLNIIIEDLNTSVDKKDLMEVKNFASLRSCLLKVDKIIDPLIAINDDMVKFVRENSICRDTDLLGIFNMLTPEMLQRWAKKDMEKKKIITYTDPHKNLYFLDGASFQTKMTGLHQVIIKDNDRFNQLTHIEKNEYISLMDLLCDVGSEMLLSGQLARTMLGNENGTQRIRQMIREYEDFKNREKEEAAAEQEIEEEHESVIKKIVSFFTSLFSRRESHEEAMSVPGTRASGKRKKSAMSRATKDLYGQIKTRNAPIIALSDYLELAPDNETKVDTIINEIRQNNLKIVIPIYNARTVLYPVKSQDYLISDIDYLMVDPDIIQTPELIREFTDSLAGYKIKDEAIPGRAILNIENYLLTLYRQKRAQKLRKKRQ
ncbi:MAG: hypothetical protein CVV44_14530 [Spirochaetae bacterium HGW-Spirochaetae-1]|jgi:hypothetical protein|nr:MAG: hypothetical protein CVV44_14530 [Spirochaetae bacterium HGW-Spirochaetae-1]